MTNTFLVADKNFEAQSKDAVESMPRFNQIFLFFIACYFLIQTISRILIGDGYGYDELEAIRFMEYELGYPTSNPPLFNWIFLSVYSIINEITFSLAITKNLLLLLLYFAFYAIGIQATGRHAHSLLMVLLLMSMPQIVWQNQITLSHSTAAAAATGVFILTFVTVVRRPSTLNFVFLGLAIAAGILSKYNVSVVIVSIFLAAASVARIRDRIFQYRLLVCIFTALICLAPHFYWMLQNTSSTIARLDRLRNLDPAFAFLDLPGIGVDGVLSLSRAFVLSLLPTCLVWLIVRRLVRSKSQSGTELSDDAKALGTVALRAFGLGAAGWAIVIFLADLSFVHDRYVTPLALLMPVALALKIPALNPDKIVRRLGQIAVAVATLLLFIVPLYLILGPYRLAYPYREVASIVAQEVGSSVDILLPPKVLGENYIRLLPGSRLYSRGKADRPVVVLWDLDRSAGLPIPLEIPGCYQKPGALREIDVPYRVWSAKRAHVSMLVFKQNSTPCAGEQ